MYARNTNVQPHPVAACRVGWLTLVPGGRTRCVLRSTTVACPGSPCCHRTRMGLLGRGL